MVDAGTEPNSVSLGFLPGPSSTCVSSLDLASLPQRHVAVTSTPVAPRCAKRLKTTGELSTPKQTDLALPSSLCEGPILDPNTSRTPTRGSGASVELFSGTTVSQRVILDTSGQNSVSSSTDLAPEIDRDPKMPSVQASMVQTTGLAVPNTGAFSGFSTHARTPGFQTKVVQTLEQRLHTSLISTPDNPSVMEVFSPPSISLRNNAAVLNSTTFDSHGRHSSKFMESSPHLSPGYGIPKVTLTTAVRPNIVAPSLPRLSDDVHEAGNIGENPVPRTPAGFNTAANPNISNITSPGDMSSGRFHHASGGSSAAQPLSSAVLIPKELKARKAVNSDSRTRKVSNSDGSSNKDKPNLVTPLEYAQKLLSCLDPHVKPKMNYLKGKRIFYIGGDMVYASATTRGRMEYVCHLHILSHFSLLTATSVRGV